MAKKIALSSKSKVRKIQQSKYKTLKISKRIRPTQRPIKGAFKLFAASIRLLIKDWRLFGGIVLVYLILTVVLVKGFGVSSHIADLKSSIQNVFHGSTAELTTGFALFSVLLGNANSTSSDVAGAYQSMLLIIISLVLIWALRQRLAAKKIKVGLRDAFYKGLYPLIPFLLVLITIGLQLVPLVIANFLYSAVIGGGLAVTAIEKGLWITLFVLLTLLSFYMASSSVFALYIVTLPDIRPMQALRSARDLVRHRRLLIMRKVLFLPVVLLILSALIIVPVIILSPVTAECLFFVLSMLSLAVAHSYLYHLYRELL